MSGLSTSKNRISFQGGTGVKFSKAAKNILRCDGADKFVGELNNLFGGKYFNDKLQKANVVIKDNAFEITNRSFLKDDVWGTCLVVVRDIPMAIAESACKLFGKGDAEFIQNWRNKVNQEQARNFVLDVIEEYSGRKYGVEVEEKFSKKFSDDVASNVAKVKKEYASRDERTLNRIVTSAVSALYAGADFYNISMLQNDDKTQAKKAGGKRLEQEFKRLALNAACTFIGLGVFDRHTKRNLIANAIVIAVSAGIAEIVSRLLSGTPLKRLTPEEAKIISEQRKNKQANKEQKTDASQKTKQDSPSVNFKSNLKNDTNVFAAFTSANNPVNALNVMNNQIAKESAHNNALKTENKKGKSSLVKGVAIAAAAATVYYVIDQAIKGNLDIVRIKSKFLKDNKEVLSSVNGDWSKLPEDIKKAINNLVDEYADREDKHSYLANFKKACQNKKVKVDTVKLIENLEKLKEKDATGELSGLIDKYIEHAQKFGPDGFNSKSERFIVSGVVTGLTRIAETIYGILTMPAKFARSIVKGITGFTKAEKQFDEIAKDVKFEDIKKYKKELTELQNLFVKHNNFDDAETRKKLIDTIAKRARNVEVGSETGELAHTSRTMVTAIGTWFFVNDYRNSVLIESGGKNIEGAKAETQTRIWHKIFNFIINGTLMNVFNTVCKGPVNGSLVGAATVASATELTNEFFIRKALAQPVLPKKSRQELIDYDERQNNRKGFLGSLTRGFKKLTGKKSLVEKSGINKTKNT